MLSSVTHHWYHRAADENCHGNRHRAINCEAIAAMNKCDGKMAFLGKLQVLQTLRACQNFGEAWIFDERAFNTAADMSAVNPILPFKDNFTKDFLLPCSFTNISAGKLAITALVQLKFCSGQPYNIVN